LAEPTCILTDKHSGRKLQTMCAQFAARENLVGLIVSVLVVALCGNVAASPKSSR